MLSIFNKEFKSYFYSASGYVFIGIFLLICGVFFANYNLIGASTDYSSVLSSIVFVFLMLVPVITMKLLAEEKHQKTDQLLLTSPVSVTDIVLGKYFASVALFLITLAVTGLYPIILSKYGTVSAGEVITTYIGFALMGASFIAVGIFVSSLTENQVIAAVATFGVLLLLWVLNWVQQGLPSGRNSGIVFALVLAVAVGIIIYYFTRNVVVSAVTALVGALIVAVIALKSSTAFEGFLPNFFSWISLLDRYDNFGMGILDLSSIIYYITFSIAFVYLTIVMVEKRRWS